MEQSQPSPVTRLASRLLEPVDGASLAVFRIAFGVLIAWDVSRFFRNDWISRYYVEPRFHFTYYGFGWVHPWPGVGMYLHFAVLGAAAVCVALGLWYRVTAPLLWLTFTYAFLLDEARYLNHFYAASLFAFLLILVPADRVWSIDAWRRRQDADEMVPRWSVWLLRAQVGMIYFFGGVAKINGDWMHGEPMRTWLLESKRVPFIDLIVRNRLELYFFSYGGLFFDLLVVPALLWRRTRPFAFAAALLFHVMNSQLFSIGIFPWMMLAATTLFFDPGWPRRFADVILRKRSDRRIVATTGRSFASLRMTRGEPKATKGASLGMTLLVGVYLLLQILIPLRHFAYPGNVSWTEEGHLFSWQMKLREKDGTVRFIVTNPHSGETTVVEPQTILTSWQTEKMSTRPDMILQFAHYLANERRRADGQTVQVRAMAVVSLNGHESRQLVDPSVDLAAEPRTLWPASWITRGEPERPETVK